MQWRWSECLLDGTPVQPDERIEDSGLEHLSCGIESLIQFPDLIIKRFGFAYLKRK